MEKNPFEELVRKQREAIEKGAIKEKAEEAAHKQLQEKAEFKFQQRNQRAREFDELVTIVLEQYIDAIYPEYKYNTELNAHLESVKKGRNYQVFSGAVDLGQYNPPYLLEKEPFDYKDYAHSWWIGSTQQLKTFVNVTLIFTHRNEPKCFRCYTEFSNKVKECALNQDALVNTLTELSDGFTKISNEK